MAAIEAAVEVAAVVIDPPMMMYVENTLTARALDSEIAVSFITIMEPEFWVTERVRLGSFAICAIGAVVIPLVIVTTH